LDTYQIVQFGQVSNYVTLLLINKTIPPCTLGAVVYYVSNCAIWTSIKLCYPPINQ